MSGQPIETHMAFSIDDILELEPLPVERPWGGDGVRRLFGWSARSSRPIGEWWLLSCRAEAPSIVRDGRYRGRPLLDVIAAEGERLLGRGVRRAARFPLLVKMLDTAERLSVQLHPTDVLLPGEGKTEAWYVLQAEPDGHLYLGLKPGITLADFFARAEAGHDVEPMLQRFAAERNQAAYLPAGLIHALGSGVVALEVQESSDTTYRIFDWNRMPRRELHLAQARHAASADQHAIPQAPAPAGKLPHQCTSLIECSAFAMHSHTLSGELRAATSPERFECWILLSGEASLQVAGRSHRLARGHAVLLPAALGDYTVVATGRAELVQVLPPKDPERPHA
jgi:mannose-6-phosphate isomerase